MRNNKVKDIAYMALYLALFVVLDWLSNQIGLFRMPQGGTLGLGIIALLMASYHLGWKKGVGVCLLSVIMQFMTGQMYIIQHSDGFSLFMILVQFLMEYPLAFGVYGLAPLFPNAGKFWTGIAATNLIRLALHVIAGTVFWAVPWWGSFTYNAFYMIPTMLLCLVVVPVLTERIRPVLHS